MSEIRLQVVADLSPDAMQLQMLSIAAALKEIGYDIEVCVGKYLLLVYLVAPKATIPCFQIGF